MVDQLTVNVDVAPTLLDLGGISPQLLDAQGESIKPLIMGSANGWNRNAIMMAYHYDPEYPEAVPHFVSMRDGQYKLVRFGNRDPKGGTEGDDQLFDLTKDPFEVNNLINDPKYAAEKKSLEQKLADLKAKYDFCQMIPRNTSDYFRQIPGGGEVPLECVRADKVYDMYKSRSSD
jgi:arylsulfatase A-like enzyme